MAYATWLSPGCGDTGAASPPEAQADVSRALPVDSVPFGPAPGDYYLSAAPGERRAVGVLVLMCGFAQAPRSIPPETALPALAPARGYYVLLLGNGATLAPTPRTRQRLDRAFAHFRENHPDAAALPWAIGGFSAGGTHALRYVEHAATSPTAPDVDWRAVFTVDAPVDLFDIERYFRRELAVGTAAAGIQEARFATGTLAQNLGTLPRDSAAFLEATPFATHANAPGNERYLADVAVRVYHDVDVGWLIRERGRTLYESNAAAASALVVALRRAGHPRADFAQATGEGYRSDGRRHPHSWSIAEPSALLDWLDDARAR